MSTQVADRPIIGGLEKQLLTQPKDVKFCATCVVSNQRPRIVFDAEGVCSACRFSYEKYHVIDWKEREHQLDPFREFLERRAPEVGWNGPVLHREL